MWLTIASHALRIVPPASASRLREARCQRPSAGTSYLLLGPPRPRVDQGLKDGAASAPQRGSPPAPGHKTEGADPCHPRIRAFALRPQSCSSRTFAPAPPGLSTARASVCARVGPSRSLQRPRLAARGPLPSGAEDSGVRASGRRGGTDGHRPEQDAVCPEPCVADHRVGGGGERAGGLHASLHGGTASHHAGAGRPPPPEGRCRRPR